MEQHLRAALAECDARLTSLAAEQQLLMDRRGFILRALDDQPKASPPAEPPAPPPPAAKATRSLRPGAGEQITAQRAHETPGSERAVLGAFRRPDTVLSLREIARHLNADPSKAKAIVQRMVRAGTLTATGRTNGRRYHLPAKRTASPAPAIDTEGDSPDPTPEVATMRADSFDRCPNLEDDDDQFDDAQEAVEAFRCPVAAARLTDPRLRQLPTRTPDANQKPAWWTGLTRDEFAHLSDFEAERMRTAHVNVPSANRILCFPV